MANRQKGIDYPGVSVVFFCHDGKGRFLMGLRGKNCRDEVGNWDIGGGGLDFGVPVDVTLHKEISEEYGTTVIEYEFLGFRDIFRKLGKKQTHWLALFFKVLVDPTKVKNNEPHKFDDVQWFTLGTLPKNVHSHMAQFVKDYKDKLEV